MPSFAEALNEQVGNEFAASQQYIAVAVHYDAQTLPQLAAHFYRQAVEERNHAMMIVQYLLDADQDVVVPGVDPPQTDFQDVDSEMQSLRNVNTPEEYAAALRDASYAPAGPD